MVTNLLPTGKRMRESIYYEPLALIAPSVSQPRPLLGHVLRSNFSSTLLILSPTNRFWMPLSLYARMFIGTAAKCVGVVQVVVITRLFRDFVLHTWIGYTPESFLRVFLLPLSLQRKGRNMAPNHAVGG